MKNPVITTMPATSEHVMWIRDNLRSRDKSIATKAGISQHEVLYRIYRNSLTATTVFCNGEIAAIWGVMGTFLGRSGRPWLIASPIVEDYPMKLAFRYRGELKNMLKRFSVLEDWVCADDDKTIKFLKILGFKFDAPSALGKNNIMFMKATLGN